MTIRSRIIHVLDRGQVMTASQMCNCINDEFKADDVKLASLSSALNKMYRNGELARMDQFGPRGGYGYLLKKDNDEDDRNQTKA